MLTVKQQNFCKNIVAGMSNKDAYITAYDFNGKDNTAYTEAYKLLLRDDIQKYIETLNKPIEKAYQTSIISERQKQIKEIQERIAICKEKEDEQSLIRYYDMLNKIYGVYKDTEQEQKTESTVNNLDTDTLKRLSKIS
jgi:hypothetical protein